MSTRKQDMLIFISDQHAGFCSGYAGDRVVRTPHLDRIAQDGTVFDAAYTSYPLCVPARMSMLSGQLPSKNGVMENAGSLPSDQATFLHALGAEGYDTVLCGRMHFEGPDQRHGFSTRIFGDLTPLYTGDWASYKERKHFARTFAEVGCLDIIGGGNSPTLEYDRQVIHAALNYLNDDHDKPQCLVVGTYAPHFPYVAPVDLFSYYRDKVELPATIRDGCNYDHPIFQGRVKDTTEETLKHVRAAYWGMVEFMDRNIGLVYDAWTAYLKRCGRDGVFVYLSDHGDQVGELGFYGKKTFFEPSARIPMLFQGSGIQRNSRTSSVCSIMDLGPTLCDLAGAETPPDQDGESLAALLENQQHARESRYVLSEMLAQDAQQRRIPGRMVRKGTWKYITYHGYEAFDLLFDLAHDPHELTNLAGERQNTVAELKALATQDWNPEAIVQAFRVREQHLDVQRKWVAATRPDQPERWKVPPASIEYPEIMYTSPAQGAS